MANILIVDDEPDVRMVLREILQLAEFDVVEAEDGKDAVKAVKKGGVDLVVLDIMMPEMDGLQAAHEIRRFSEVPIIVVSVKDDATTKGMAKKLYGVDYFITKPFPNKTLVDSVKKALKIK